MELDLVNELEIEDIDPSSTHTIRQLGLLNEKSNIVTSINYTSFATKQSMLHILSIYKSKIEQLQNKCDELTKIIENFILNADKQNDQLK
jgi:hypothetical protein